MVRRQRFHILDKQVKLDTHPDKGGEAFLFLEEQCRSFEATVVKEYQEKIESLVAIFTEFDFCHCLKCVRFYLKRKRCEVCMGRSPKKLILVVACRLAPSGSRGLTPTFGRITHGYNHENAQWLARGAFELRK